MNRRTFIQSAASFVLASQLEAFAAKYKQKMAYSAITWSGNDLVAIKDIAALGFKGIQLRANTYPIFKDKPEDLKLTIDSAKLNLAMFSSGNVGISDDVKKDIETHVNHAKFVKALGGQSLQITNTSRPKDRQPTKEELAKYAKNMSAVAKAVLEETGIQPAYHNHMHQLGETPEEIKIIVNEMDTKYIKLLLDVAIIIRVEVCRPMRFSNTKTSFMLHISRILVLMARINRATDLWNLAKVKLIFRLFSKT